MVGIDEIPTPAMVAGGVRVKINAAAVNFPDVLIVANEYQVKLPPPFVPGSEFAGEVLEVAEDVNEFAAGDRVFGTSFVGAFAEEVIVPAGSLTGTPETVGDESAAAFGIAHRTAYHALRSCGSLHAGEELIVLGAGGGVGLASVQLGSILGASVTAVASSPNKLDAAKAMGADRVIDHTTHQLRDALRELLPGGGDVVIDPVGGQLAEPTLRSLRWGGRFVTVGYASGEIPKIPLNLVLLKGVHVVGFEFRGFVSNHPDDARRNESELLDLLGSGRAFPHIGATFHLDQTAEALRYVGDGRAIGKVVITVP
ncbi:MAG TPA: NADPH:quinone oxidoreductase family protein [Acidimicrobiales bacterium]|nr:NADPH:quinone oxidoreductase family protein [Acidimicrobiales bacterium]